jgi:hypothetical protein
MSGATTAMFRELFLYSTCSTGRSLRHYLHITVLLINEEFNEVETCVFVRSDLLASSQQRAPKSSVNIDDEHNSQLDLFSTRRGRAAGFFECRPLNVPNVRPKPTE